MMLSMRNDLRALEASIANRITKQLNHEEVLTPEQGGRKHVLNETVKNDGSGYYKVVEQYQLDADERLVLLLALLPHVLPHYLSTIAHAYKLCGKVAIEQELRGLLWTGDLPTVELVMFVLADFDLITRSSYADIFEPQGKLFESHLVALKAEGNSAHNLLKSGIAPTQILLNRVREKAAEENAFSADFPAKKVKSKLTWADLILEGKTRQQIADIISWQQNKDIILKNWGLDKIIKPGYRALFYGPPGTGKTMSANLIGQELGIDVFRIDLSMIVSKYIGETEKNLDKLFNRAEKENWVLFFDEADALFGKRTSVGDAHDKYANQETSYLLQRIEDFDGIVILASNFKNNIDEAFSRRFQAIIEFKLPSAEQREMLWGSMFPKVLKLEDNVDIKRIAQKFELSGGSILNVVQHVALRTAQRQDMTIRYEDVVMGVKTEYYKQGKHLKI